MDDAEQTLVEIGNRLRAARQLANLTLSQVAAKADLAESSLSRIERGSIAVSVMNLVRLCEVLSIGINELFDPKPTVSKTVVAVHSPRSEPFKEVEATGYRWRHLAGGAPLDAFEVLHLVFPEREKMQTLVSHPGQEHCYVLEGEVDFYVGSECHRLGPGAGILIDSEVPHRAERVGDGPVHILMTVTRTAAGKTSPEWWNSPGQEPRRTA